MNNFFGLVLVLIFSCTMSSCDDSAPSNDALFEDKEAIILNDVLAKEDTGKFNFVIPSALQTSILLKSSGLTYIEGLANSTEKVSLYTSRFDKLLNLGVYTTDLFYCVLNDKPQQSFKYFRVNKQLADEAGLISVFDAEQIFTKFEENIGNKDSLFEILIQHQERMDELIAENNEEHSAMIIFCGVWTEGMYMGLNSVVSLDNENLKKRIIEQVGFLQNLINGLAYQPNRTEQIINTQKKYEELLSYFENIDGIKSGEEGTYNYEVLTLENWNKVYEIVDDIRNQIIKS